MTMEYRADVEEQFQQVRVLTLSPWPYGRLLSALLLVTIASSKLLPLSCIAVSSVAGVYPVSGLTHDCFLLSRVGIYIGGVGACRVLEVCRPPRLTL